MLYNGVQAARNSALSADQEWGRAGLVFRQIPRFCTASEHAAYFVYLSPGTRRGLRPSSQADGVTQRSFGSDDRMHERSQRQNDVIHWTAMSAKVDNIWLVTTEVTD